MTWIFLFSAQLHPRQYEVFSICLTSSLKYQARLQSQSKPNGSDGFVAVKKNHSRQKVFLSNHSLSNLFKQPQFSSKHIISRGQRRQTEVESFRAFLMTPACPCKVSNGWFNPQLPGENFKTKDQRLPSCFPVLQSVPACFYYILLLLLSALWLGKALWMGQCPDGVSESSKPGVVHMEPCWRWLGQHHMPDPHCSTTRQILLEEEALESSGWLKAMQICHMVKWSWGDRTGMASEQN